ncbi:hypothetical protein BGZ63DRAFT_17181 [Mariannaea sp. PMI_226]|nr:hypothetical protein BGZ63DRAFT_17181 [Mariannaea sp. PMI_226]
MLMSLGAVIVNYSAAVASIPVPPDLSTQRTLANKPLPHDTIAFRVGEMIRLSGVSRIWGMGDGGGKGAKG